MTTKPMTVKQYAAVHKLNAKSVRRALRALKLSKPAKGWMITPALAKKLAA